MVLEQLEVDQRRRLADGPLDEERRGREADEEDGEGVDAERPGQADLLDELLERERQRDTAERAAGVEDAVGGTATQKEPLGSDAECRD